MNNIWHGLLSSICITIPEYIFIIIITLRFMGRKEMLDFFDLKNNVISILKIVIPPALLLDMLNYIIHSSPLLNSILSYITLYTLLICILKQPQRSIINYPYLEIKAFKYLIYSFFVAVGIEFVTMPIIFKLLNKTYGEIKINLYLVIICSLSSRILDVIILFYVFIRKNSRFQFHINEYIFKNKFFSRLILVSIISLAISEIYFMKLILYNNFLTIISSIYEQLLLIISFTFLMPCLIIAMVYSFINYCVMIINSENQTFRND